MSDVSIDRLMRFVLDLRQRGITDARVLGAMERTSRTHFAPAPLVSFALEERALPIGEDQEMTSPAVVGRMLSALDLRGGDTVLEVGAGSGYQAAVLGAIARRVVSLERRQTLASEARGKIGQLRAMHVYIHYADGLAGWPDERAFDRIVVNAAVEEPPPALAALLPAGGVLVAPTLRDGVQRIVQYRKATDGSLTSADIGPAAFAPIEAGLA